MTCSLSGQFVEFTADFSHADELGGELTSLITGGPYTHWLLRDVLVDLPGRDEIRDFLALDGGTLRVYESDSTTDTAVIDQSGVSSLEGSGEWFLLSVPVTAGFLYVKLPDPNGGGKEIREVIRSDGKRIKPENVWISKTRLADHTWAWFFNIFDANSPGGYAVSFGEPSAAPDAGPGVHSGQARRGGTNALLPRPGIESRRRHSRAENGNPSRRGNVYGSKDR